MNRLMFSGAQASFALRKSVSSSGIVLSSLLGLAVLGLASQANAASYGNFSSPTGTVSFLNVEDVNGLFGMPVASGNSLDFSPNTFEVDCASAPSCPPTPGTATDTLTFQIDADSGFFIEDIILSEAGDTTINNFTVPTGFAATTIVANVFIDILELDGSSVSGINGNASMIFTADGTFDTNTEGNGSHVWTGLLSLDVDAFIAAASQTGKATLVEISLANTLTAYAENGAVAFIEKKDIDGLAITVVPEPGTALLMGLGLTALSLTSRRSDARRHTDTGGRVDL